MESLVIGLFLGYYWTGFEMVEFHTISDDIDRPQYVDGPVYRKAISAMLWPLVTRLNREFGWFFSCFVAYLCIFKKLCSNLGHRSLNRNFAQDTVNFGCHKCP